MRKLKKALSLTLALALSLALAAPVMAAGETTIQDGGGFRYTLSKPLVGTRGLIYQISEGTIITPVFSEGAIKDDSDVEYSVWFCVDSSGGPTQEVEESWNIMPVGPLEDIQPLSKGFLYYLLSENNANGDFGEAYFEVVSDNGSVTPDQPQQPTTPNITVENIPASGTAVASTQTVTVDGKAVEFQMYALLDANGNGTNYVKLRDMAYILNGTAAQFSVGYSAEAGITLVTGQPYQANGSEMSTPFSGNRAYTGGGQSVQINGGAVELTAINLLDDQGGGYNYFKLRDLGAALGFHVDWSADKGIYVETDKA